MSEKNRKSWPWVTAFMAALRANHAEEYHRSVRIANEVVGPEPEKIAPASFDEVEDLRKQTADQGEQISALEVEVRAQEYALQVCAEAFTALAAGTDVETPADAGDREAWERLAEVKSLQMESAANALSDAHRALEEAKQALAFAEDKAATLERLQAERDAEHRAALEAVQDNLAELQRKYAGAVPAEELRGLIARWDVEGGSIGKVVPGLKRASRNLDDLLAAHDPGNAQHVNGTAMAEAAS